MSPSPIDIAPAALLAGPGFIACALCGRPAARQWQRRLTDAELADHQAIEQGQRDEHLLLADAQQPPPAFPPLPAADDCLRPVHACAEHTIDESVAAQVHQASCSAPPACDCTPEPLPAPELIEMPAGWAATGGGG
ncbi:hypothetical protein QMK19_03620 [Streptomyces sp. H10-C2]|uniref:hypothetical protein n=1 Tax=unclassified Streptomyces TaxID=2593676 RepID=UPI0024BBE051|nr:MULTISPECIES: hypothetical protein [unclassified Streptomyces]MDJ0342276.1 hypothetical protein [Streptomyces sp. PH10-H1]MDJ0368790.1 hypothetical protein [Streptomyces sp. H10-C2]